MVNSSPGHRISDSVAISYQDVASAPGRKRWMGWSLAAGHCLNEGCVKHG